MIRIQEHIKQPNPEAFLIQLAEDLWNELNPKLKKGGSYYYNSLIAKITRIHYYSKSKKYLKEVANNDGFMALRHQAFFEYLIFNNYENLRLLVISAPVNLTKFRNEILNILDENDLFFGGHENPNQTKFGKLLSEELFNYKSFRKSEFCKNMFVKLRFESATCPYCNDHKVEIVKVRNNSTSEILMKAYLDLDHFFPKSQNPFFAVSFFNLIPVCHICNSSEKGHKPFEIDKQIHPYCDSFDNNFRFRISLKKLLGDPIDSIFIDNIGTRNFDRTVEDLKLDDRYNNNFRVASELADLYFKGQKHIGTEFETDFYELILKDIPKNRSDILIHQRAKMNRDILKQIDISKSLGIV